MGIPKKRASGNGEGEGPDPFASRTRPGTRMRVNRPAIFPTTKLPRERPILEENGPAAEAVHTHQPEHQLVKGGIQSASNL